MTKSPTALILFRSLESHLQIFFAQRERETKAVVWYMAVSLKAVPLTASHPSLRDHQRLAKGDGFTADTFKSIDPRKAKVSGLYFRTWSLDS